MKQGGKATLDTGFLISSSCYSHACMWGRRTQTAPFVYLFSKYVLLTASFLGIDAKFGSKFGKNNTWLGRGYQFWEIFWATQIKEIFSFVGNNRISENWRNSFNMCKILYWKKGKKQSSLSTLGDSRADEAFLVEVMATLSLKGEWMGNLSAKPLGTLQGRGSILGLRQSRVSAGL